MNIHQSVHNLRYHIVALSNPLYGFIAAGGNKIHQITDVDLFYKALGYTDDVKKNGLMAEEFVWEEYRKDNSRLSPTCLQAKIIDYLLMNSPSFNIHSEQYRNWIGGCFETPLQEQLKCANCLLHPSQTDF